jgi:Spy/CpxP family protein refolding chaperone
MDRRTTHSSATPTTGRRTRLFIRNSALTAVIAVGAIGLFSSVSPAARAFGMGPGQGDAPSLMERMHGGMTSHQALHAHFDQVMDQAGVAAAQKQQIHGIMRQALTDTHADMQRYHASFGRLATLLAADPIDDAAVAVIREEQGRLASAMSGRMTDAALTAAKVLTPAQRVKLRAEIDRMMAAHDPHHSAD